MKYPRLLLFTVFFLASCVSSQAPTQTPTQTFTPPPTATQTPSPTPTVVPTPTQVGGGSGQFIFEYFRAGFESKFPELQGELNIFISDWNGENLVPVTNGLNGYNHVESVSPDGRMALVSSFPQERMTNENGDLYLVNLKAADQEPVKFVEKISKPSGDKVAYWLNISQIAYIGKGREGRGIYVVNIDGTNSIRIGPESGVPVRILSADKTRVYWGTDINIRTGPYVSNFRGVWWSNIDGSGSGKLEANGKQIIYFYNEMAFSPDGNMIAWIPGEREPDCRFDGIRASHIRDGTTTFDAKELMDEAYAESFAKQCLLMYVAKISDMDNPIKIPLIPPLDPFKEDFSFNRDYQLTWWQDESKILLFNRGRAELKKNGFPEDYFESPRLFYVMPTNSDAKLGQISTDLDGIYIGDFSPDGHQILLSKYDGHGPFTQFINIFNLDTLTYSEEFGRNITPDSEVSRIWNIYWLP